MSCSACKKVKDIGESLVIWAKAGMPFANIDTVKTRLDVCSLCEYRKNRTCSKCGCFIEAKTRLATSKCPIGKW